MELHVIEREGRKTVVLLDNEMRIVKPVYDYLKFQRQKDKALNTLKASGSDLRTYWEFLNDNGYEYDKVTPKMIAEFIDYLRASDDDVIALNKESKRTNKTINRILSTIHMFYQFEADMQEIDNPILMHDINRPFNAFKGILEHAKSDNKTKQSIFKVKESDYKINLVTDDEMELFLSRLDKRRDILLYKMLYLTGARIQEVLDLEIDSVPLPDMSQLVGCFRQIKSKGKTRDLYVPMSLIKELDDFIMEERNLIDTDHSYIFVSEQKRQLGKQLTYRAAYDKLKKVQEEIGVDFNFHDLRHTFCSNLVQSGIQQVLGHSDPSVTKRFYADVKDKERAEVFQSVGVIGNINQIQSSVFDNVSEFEWFKANKDKCVAGLCDGYCTKPVTDGNICPRLLKRQKCYTCSRYITTPEYLEAHKQHLANLEKQLEEGAIYGEHYAEHFIPTIEVLKFIIERLEGLQNGN